MSEKKMLSKFEILLGILFLGIAAYIFANKFGLSPMKKTETVEIIDRPKSSKYIKKQTNTKTRDRSDEQRKREEEVEKMLRKLSEKSDDGELNEINQFANLSSDEEKFHKEITQKEAFNKKFQDSKTWFNRLRKAHSTYDKVKGVFTDPNTTQSESTNVIEDVSKLMDNKIVANSVYNRIEELFSIPKDKSEQFAKTGKKAVSDWAKFVEENKNNEK